MEKINDYTKLSSKNFELLSKIPLKSKPLFIEELVEHYLKIRETAEINNRLKLQFDKLVVSLKYLITQLIYI